MMLLALLTLAWAKDPVETWLVGPTCATAVLTTDQQASLPGLWSDHEQHRVQARIQDGVWTYSSWETLRDDDPSEALEEGKLPFPTPGVGADDAGPKGTLEQDGRTLTVRVPERQVEGDGWMEDLVWRLVVDARGWPIAEEGRATVGEGDLTLQVRWSIRYEWTECSP